MFLKQSLSFVFIFLIAIFQINAQELYEMQKDKENKWVSFENSSGDKGKGGMENRTAKGHAFDIVKAGASIDLINIKGSGTIKRMWMTFSDRSPEMLRALKIEMFWDGSDKPAVSAPIGDFFGVGLGQRVPFESALLSDPEGRSFNCIIPMPFKTGARIIFTNESSKDLVALFYDVDILMESHEESMLYFHAYWNRENKTALGKDFQILPKVEGKGKFLGCNIGVDSDPSYEKTWFGEGEVKMYLDKDTKFPTLVGTGTEDYIGTAYGQGTFAHQYQGCTVANLEKSEFAFYRFHIPDPIYFYSDIQVEIQQIGGAMKAKVKELKDNGASLKPISIHNDDGFNKLLEMPKKIDLSDPTLPNGWTNFYRQDDVSATAYFYLDKPSNNLPAIADVASRISDLPKKD